MVAQVSREEGTNATALVEAADMEPGTGGSLFPVSLEIKPQENFFFVGWECWRLEELQRAKADPLPT